MEGSDFLNRINKSDDLVTLTEIGILRCGPTGGVTLGTVS